MADFIPFLDWQEKEMPAMKKLTVGKDFIFFDDYQIPPICYEPFTSEFVTVWLLQKGEIDFSIGGIRFMAKAPCIVVMQPGVPRRVVGKSKNAKKKLMALSKAIVDTLFENPIDRTFFSRKFLLGPVLPLNEKDYQTYLLYLDLVKREMEDPDNPYPKHTVAGILKILISKYPKKNPQKKITKNSIRRKESLVQDFFIKLNDHHRKERSSRFYASELSVTPQHLSKILQEETDKPAGVWIDTFVIESMKASLRSEGKSMKAVADEFSFHTVDCMGKYFKRHAEMSPSAYRKKYGI